MKVLGLFIFGSALVATALSAQNCHLRELDMCIASVAKYLANPATAVPENEEQINEQCANIRELQSCLVNFTGSCMTPIQREVVGNFIINPIAAVDDYCNEGGTMRQNVLKHSGCIRESVTSNEMRACLADVQAAVDVFVDPPEDMYLFGCCTADRFRKCVENIVENKCGKEVVDLAIDILGTASGNIVTNICNCVDSEGDKCNDVLPPPGTTPQGKSSKSPLARLLAAFLPAP